MSLSGTRDCSHAELHPELYCQRCGLAYDDLNRRRPGDICAFCAWELAHSPQEIAAAIGGGTTPKILMERFYDRRSTEYRQRTLKRGPYRRRAPKTQWMSA